jgi:hypothetical protein
LTSLAAHEGPVVVVRRSVLLVLVVVVLGGVHLRHRPATFCLLREFTGVPCPFCGGTTALARLGAGHFRESLAASPLALLMVALAPVAGVVQGPWTRRPALTRTLVIVVLVASEMWQLNRFGVI